MKDYLFSKEMQEYINKEKEAAFIAGWTFAIIVVAAGVIVLSLCGFI